MAVPQKWEQSAVEQTAGTAPATPAPVQRTGFRAMLFAELTRRVQSNPSYSLRSFARQLGVSPATLSGVLNNRRKLSLETAEKIVMKLGLEPREAAKFYQSVAAEFLPNSPGIFQIDE